MINCVNTLDQAYYSNCSAKGSKGKIYVPVKPSLVGYTQFDHVSGFAADTEQGTSTVNNLSLLESLIDKLVDVTAKKTEMKSVPQQNPEFTEKQLDSMIDDIQNQIKSIAVAAEISPEKLLEAYPKASNLISLTI